MTHARAWWHANRSSSRIAFVLQMLTRVGNALLGLVWTRLLLRYMGESLFGSFATFQSIAALGGIGELGLGAVVSVRVAQQLGRGELGKTHDFLATARAAFTSLTLLVLVGGAIAAPWLPGWLGFKASAGAGSLPTLFVFGAVNAALLVFTSYISNVNYAVGSVMWPVIPSFMLTQMALAGHCVLAFAGSSLAVQFVPYVASAVASLLYLWLCVRTSHPELAGFLPLRFELREWLGVLSSSFWSYLWSIGNLVYIATDRVLINKGFGSKPVAAYTLNNKLCELALFVVVAAGLVSLPKLTAWLASSDGVERERAKREVARLNNVQAFLGCSAAIIYLILNDWFIGWWVGEQNRIPLSWQWALAVNLAITASGAACIQLSPRCGRHGIRRSGALVGITALANVGLSVLAMKLGSIFGIAFATVVAQSFFTIVVARIVLHEVGGSWSRWILKFYLFPLVVVSAAYALRLANQQILIGIGCLALLLATAFVTRVTPRFVQDEIAAIAGAFRTK